MSYEPYKIPPTKVLLEASHWCSEECREIYPYYGVAPHLHVSFETEGFLNNTSILDKRFWPKNFREDLDSPGHGTWLCPKCLNADLSLEASE